MSKLINFHEEPVRSILKNLLLDMTTGENIIFATDSYTGNPRDKITVQYLIETPSAFEICPRVEKDRDIQNARTRKKAEVFTPSWICNKMNNHCDSEWFGRDNVFNIENNQEWTTIREKILFTQSRKWQDYVSSKRLEITCGEAPYIVSRYDAATGEIIDVNNRIGILDRKLRVITENTENEKEWIKWAYKAYQSVYGFEFQGDNLLIARVNLILTFCDYINYVWEREATISELKKLTKIVVWNFWQMDGITGTVPFGKPCEEYHQISFWDYEQGINDTEPEQMDCKIYDWVNKEEVTYRSIKG
jgi:hypothetical protein